VGLERHGGNGVDAKSTSHK